MPELPEVEVVRRGLAEHVTGRTLEHVELLGTRVARRHVAGPADLADQRFANQADAESWVGEVWAELAAEGVAAGGRCGSVLLMIPPVCVHGPSGHAGED